MNWPTARCATTPWTSSEANSSGQMVEFPTDPADVSFS